MDGSKTVANGVYESEYMRVPIIKTRSERIKHCFYNPEDNTYFSRTKRQWGITGLFYLVFLSCLALMFAVCMKGMLATLSDERPRYILEDSLIGTNPGLSFRPTSANFDITISYRPSNASDVRYWIRKLDKFLDDYKNASNLPNAGRNQQVCDYQQKARDGMVCSVDISKWGPCTSEQGYGFNNSAPCVFIKLNRLIGWTPQVYEPNDLPSEMPASLKTKIEFLKGTPQLNTIWLSCNGKNKEHHESMGEVEYYSVDSATRGFPSYYYPYDNIAGYLSPLVAVQFLRPQRNKIISIECRAWAKNIKHEVKNQMGLVSFELVISE